MPSTVCLNICNMESHILTAFAVGLGAFSAPWVATQFAKRERWSFFYLVSLAIAVVNAFCLIAVFRGHTQKGITALR